jgi:hypothetical protein
MQRKAVVRLILLLLGLTLGFVLRGCLTLDRRITLTNLSLDDTLQVIVVERPAFIDRNFEVRVENINSGRESTVFRSPDEGRPVGSERIVWSADGSRFLLVGRHFFVSDRGKLPSGEQAYLMMDLRSGRLWCNARQQSEHPGFGVEELREVRWLGCASLLRDDCDGTH